MVLRDICVYPSLVGLVKGLIAVCMLVLWVDTLARMRAEVRP